MDIVEHTVTDVRLSTQLLIHEVQWLRKSVLYFITDVCIIYLASACNAGYHGANCSHSCSHNCKRCQHTDGLCTCNAGWMGPNCTTGKC